MKTCAVYIRVSTDKQLENSPESQLEAIKKYAQNNDFLILPEHIYAEQEGQSGRYAEKRPEFQRMITNAKQKPKPFEAILVWKFSRFARNREDSIVYKRMLRKQCGVDVISVGENLGNSENALNDMIEAIIECMDEYFSINLGEEVKRGMINKVRNGEYVSSPPIGYDLVNKLLVVNEESAEIVRMIFNDYVNNNMGVRTIAMKLDKLGIRSKKGVKICVSSVIYILCNPLYVGKVRWSTKGRIDINKYRNPRYENENFLITDGIHEPIIDKDIFEKAQKKMAEMSIKYPKKKRDNEEVKMLLKGLVRCSKCDSTLIAVRYFTFYQCGGYGRGVCKYSHFIKKETLDNVVISELEKIFSGENLEEYISAVPVVPVNKLIIENQIKRQEDKIQRIKDGYDCGIYSLEETKERINAETDILNNLKNSTTEKEDDELLHNKAVKIKGGVKDILLNPDISTAQKNTFLKSFIDKIVFNRDENEINIFFK